MTEETAQAVRAAAAQLRSLQEATQQEKRQAMARVAAAIPDHIDALAKSYAKAEPEVTRSLGREGVDALRSELAAEAERLARLFQASADDIRWPRDWSVGTQDIAEALRKRFLRDVDGPAEILERHGYKVSGSGGWSRQTEGRIRVSSLYASTEFGTLAKLLTEELAAERALESAKRADEQADVEELWS